MMWPRTKCLLPRRWFISQCHWSCRRGRQRRGREERKRRGQVRICAVYSDRTARLCFSAKYPENSSVIPEKYGHFLCMSARPLTRSRAPKLTNILRTVLGMHRIDRANERDRL